MKKIIFLFTLITLQLSAQTFPPGFSQVKVGSIYYPTSLAFAPDGRIFVTEKAGKVKIIKNGVVLSTPFYQVSVDQLNERGLGCIAIDPNFSTNNYVYIYYTTSTAPIHNRLSRITANGDVAMAGSEVPIYDFDPSVNSIHNGGGMVWDPDGTLYLAVGNDNVNANSQDLDSYKGKVIRINTDFSIPTGNPYTSGSEAKKRIWAYGLRNPWSLAIQPGTGKLFVNDVGEGAWEEINDATTGGKNFGWPGSEGMTGNPAYTNPVYTYPHGFSGTDSGCAITGGTFFNPASTAYPAQYTGKYFFLDYCNDWINYIDPSNGQKSNFVSGLPGSSNYIKVSPDGKLYYFSIGQNSLYKIIYSNNNIPVVTTQPADVTIPQGQQSSFNVTASGATPLSYQWKKNGNVISGAPNSSTYTIANTQMADVGQYSVDVSNSYGNDVSNDATLTVIAANGKPTATIISPASGTFYRDGDLISFSGDATDPEDGTLPASAFEWVVEFHHNLHIHPGPTVPAGTKTGTFSTTFGEPSANVYFRLILIVSDAQGQKDSAFVDIHPVTSTINLVSQPPGRELLLEAQPHIAPYSVLAVSGMTHSIGVNTPQITADSIFVFDHWIQGGNASQNFIVTDNDVTLTAVFNSSPNAIQDLDKPFQLKIFPNPFNEYFTVMLDMKTTKEKKAKMTIVNLIGEAIYERDCSIRNGELKESIKLDDTLPTGIYTLELITESNVIHADLFLTK